jgi:cephalosporin hydroxylase
MAFTNLGNTIRHELRTLRGAFHRRLSGRQVLDDDILNNFHRSYFNARDFNLTWRNTYWLGHPILKCPLDLWLYQEILHKVRPSLIIETGTAYGGSALYLASICDLVGAGRVVTIDVTPQSARPSHPRITYIDASSTSPDTVDRVRSEIGHDDTVMVILDSDHRMAHVADELALYHSFVSPGSYLIVEDTNLNGHPVEPEFGPGPMEAVEAFLPSHPEFTHDAGMDKFLLSFNPKGFLRRR